MRGCAGQTFNVESHSGNKEMIDEADEASLLEHLPALHYKEVIGTLATEREHWRSPHLFNVRGEELEQGEREEEMK
ncbi:hypothetical protein INR49_010181 [Caranx melampygus]|nr:hypothetical protein INR49_010181 [Caranx melampygus]